MTHGIWGRLAALGLLVSLGPLSAQQNIGVVTGTVADSSGAVIPGVAITIRSEALGTSIRVETQADGAYIAPNMQPGVYTLRAEAEGFQTVEVSGLRLDTGGRLIQDFSMTVGAVAETITVEGVTSLVDVTRGTIGDVVENKRVVELPLNGREVFDLVSLMPGTFRMRNNTRASGGDVSIGGGRTRSAAVYIDGVINSRTGIGATITELSTSIDSIGEFRVDTNSAGAEMGRSAAGFVNATTKSGTNEFHGTLYEFVRNDRLDARGWDADSRAKLRRNTFGGAIGGPVIRNRTFFFYNWDELRENRAALRTRTVPLREWRTGDYSNLQRSQTTAAGVVGFFQPIYDPLTRGGAAIRGGREQFPNNVIPQSRLDPVAQKVMAFYPQPNRTPNDPINQSGNWQANVPIEERRRNHITRWDHEITEKHKLMGRYTIFDPAGDRLLASPEWGFSDPNAIDRPIRQQNALLAYTQLFSPTFFMNATAGFFRFFQHQQGGGFGENMPDVIGLRGVGPDVFPRFNIGGNPGINSIGSAGPHNRPFAFTNFEYAAHFTKVAGKHTVKFGAEYRKYQGSEQSGQQASGVFQFNGQDTRGLNAAGQAIANTGAPMADFVLGRIHDVRLQSSPTIGRRSFYTGFFIQDDWRATNRLTLNIGLRHDYEEPFYEVANRMANWDPTIPLPAAGTNGIREGQLGAMVFAGRGGEKRGVVNPDRNNFGPRFGFAFRPLGTNTTVVRGAFGVHFGGKYDGNVLQTGSQGFIRQGNLNAGNVGLPFALADGVPPTVLEIPLEEDLTPDFGTLGSKYPQSRVDFVDRWHRTPYALDYNLTIQHQVGENLIEARYFAKLGRKINFRDMNINHIRPEDLGRTDVPERLLRPYSQYAGFGQMRLNQPNFGISNYHAVSLKTERRFNKGIGYLASYTFSKWIDNVPFVGEDAASFGDADFHQDIYNIRGERALSTNHAPHRVVISPIYELPFGKGKPLLDRGGAVNAIVGGWQISTIATFQAGSPFGVTVLNGPRDLLGDNAPYRVLRANVVGDHRLPSGQQGQSAVGRRGIQWFNPDAFAAPGRFTLGNAARTISGNLGPGSRVFDIALSKNTRLNERFMLQFRWETFNSFNTAQFMNPIDQVFQAGMGTTSGGDSHRETQFGLKLYF